MFTAWNAGHDERAGRSKNGRNQVIPHSSHYIQFDQPNAVIGAIYDLVQNSRAAKKSKVLWLFLSGKNFFFEKKKQKTFVCSRPAPRQARAPRAITAAITS
jgi:hypothetical protein